MKQSLIDYTKLHKTEDYFRSILNPEDRKKMTNDISARLKLNQKNRDILVMKPVEYKAINRHATTKNDYKKER